MSGAAVFVDTWALLALINRDDAWHVRAVAVSRELNVRARPLITSEWVLTEFLGGAAHPPLRALAVECVRQACRSARFEIIAAADDVGSTASSSSRTDRTNRGRSSIACRFCCAKGAASSMFSLEIITSLRRD